MQQKTNTATKIINVRNYCFTLNNYTDTDIQHISTINPDTIQYLIFGREIAPSTGTKHLQGYIELSKSARPSYVKKLLNNKSIHLEPRCGTQEQAIVYCKKDGDYIEIGIPKQTHDTKTQKVGNQGLRSDILTIWDSIKQGYSQTDLLEHYPVQYTKYSKAIDKYYTINEPGRDRNIQTEIIWHYGPTGTNKTRTVFEVEGDNVFIPKNYKWWDGYDRHKVVLLDDIRADYCKFHELLTLLDRYQHKVEVKGGMRQLVAEKIYITSPYHPRDIYRNKTDEDIQQLVRRITSIRYFPTLDNNPINDIINIDNTIDIPHIDNTIDTDIIDNDRDWLYDI